MASACERTDKGKLVVEKCREFPKFTNTEMAKHLKRNYPKIFKVDLDSVRGLVRYYRGNLGKKLRRQCKEVIASDVAPAYMPRILLFDIETAPILAYVWKCYKENIMPSQIVKNTTILCYSAKWLGNDMIYVDSREKDKSDKRICQTLWDLIDQADVVVAHNGAAFDNKTMNTKWVEYNMPPPSPFKTVDTLMIAKKQFRFNINKLDHIARALGIGRKTPHEGFELWLKCMANDKKAWTTMREYNINDVLLLEQVYLKLRAWDKQHPNIGLMYEDGEERCVCCGNKSLKHINKTSYTSVSYFDSYRCRACGKVMRTGIRRNKPVKGSKKTIMRNSL